MNDLVADLKSQHQQRIQELQLKIEELEEEIRILTSFQYVEHDC